MVQFLYWKLFYFEYINDLCILTYLKRAFFHEYTNIINPMLGGWILMTRLGVWATTVAHFIY